MPQLPRGASYFCKDQASILIISTSQITRRASVTTAAAADKAIGASARDPRARACPRGGTPHAGPAAAQAPLPRPGRAGPPGTARLCCPAARGPAGPPEPSPPNQPALECLPACRPAGRGAGPAAPFPPPWGGGPFCPALGGRSRGAGRTRPPRPPQRCGCLG